MRISDWSSDVCSSDLWARQGHDVVRFGAATEGGLADVTVFRRDAAGRLREQIDAARAEPSGEGWMLEDVEVTRPGIPAPIHHDTLEWTAGPDRSLLRSLSAYPREMSFRSEEHTTALQSLMRISYAVLLLKKKKHNYTLSNISKHPSK